MPTLELEPENISAGTRVVSRVEVRGTNNSLGYPRGAVGVVTRTPAGGGKHFLVRFPDGFEFSLQREQLEILKYFKTRLQSSAGVSPAASVPFDLESLVIYRCIVGSRAYGLDHDDSDTDRRGVYLAPADLHWSLFGAPEQFEGSAETQLPERPDCEAANRFLIKARREMANLNQL